MNSTFFWIISKQIFQMLAHNKRLKGTTGAFKMNFFYRWTGLLVICRDGAVHAGWGPEGNMTAWALMLSCSFLVLVLCALFRYDKFLLTDKAIKWKEGENALKLRRTRWNCVEFLQEWQSEIGGVSLQAQPTYLFDVKPTSVGLPPTAGCNCNCIVVQLLLLNSYSMDTCRA